MGRDYLSKQIKKYLNVTLSNSHLKSAKCTKVRRMYSFVSLEARFVTRLRRQNAVSFEFAITSFIGQKISVDLILRKRHGRNTSPLRLLNIVEIQQILKYFKHQ